MIVDLAAHDRIFVRFDVIVGVDGAGAETEGEGTNNHGEGGEAGHVLDFSEQLGS
ncbi:MAG: hypothetical protein KF850_21775 [Labilithrix sp.]|nr:hypothetical protein [Labilithrix sp.]